MSEQMIHSKLLHELNHELSKTNDQGLKEIVQHWQTIYGTNSDAVVKELSSELQSELEEFWKLQTIRLEDRKQEHIRRIDSVGQEAIQLEKALGLKPQVTKVPENIPLIQMEEQFLSLLDSYQDMKSKRLEEYSRLQKQEQDLCSTLDMEKPRHEVEIPTTEDMSELEKRITDLGKLKEQLEYDFEDVKSQFRQLLEECEIPPLTKFERFAFDRALIPVTKKNLNMMMTSVKELKRKKEGMMSEADHLRQQIDFYSKKMFKNPQELGEFLATYSGFTEPVIKKLKETLNELKMERKQNLTGLIENSRQILRELWDKCCYSDAQRKEFKPFEATRLNEEVLEFHELEIEHLEHFYEDNKKIYSLAKKHEELWARMLHLEDQANNKDRLFNNRGGCLLKEEKERKHLQKSVPAVKEELMTLLNEYKERTGKDFTVFGEPLKENIEMKEYLRKMSKGQEKLQRKMANNENAMGESRVVRAGFKRKALTPHNQDRIKASRIETTTISLESKSTSSSKSTASSECVGTMVQKQKPPNQGQHLTVPRNNFTTMRTPVHRRLPAASTPQNGSLSYESFQEEIEKSKYLPHNSTRKTEHQKVLRPRHLNQTKIVVGETTSYKTPITPGRTFTKTPMKTPGKTPGKTPSKTPSRIPFRIPTGSKIPSKVPPVSPGKPTLSVTKLPIIF